MTATLWCITVTPILQMRSWDHEGEVCCLQVHRSMQGHQNPNQIWPAYVSRAHVLNHSRDKGRKDGPTSSNHGVNVRATRLSMSFCFFLSLLKPPQNGRNRPSCRLKYHFLSPNHVWDMVVSVLLYTMTRKSWKQPYAVRALSPTWGRRNLQRTHVLRWLFWSHKCCMWQSQRWDPGLLLVSLGCFMMESGMKLRLMVQHRADH